MKRVLSLAEIKELQTAVRKCFLLISELKRNTSIARHIKYIQVPNILSESLVAHLLERGRIFPELRITRAVSGGLSGPDVIGYSGNRQYSFEVKGTGEKGFQRLSEKDIQADYLLWMHFGDYFADETKTTVPLHIVKDPRRYFFHPGEIVLGEFKKIVGHHLQIQDININSL